MKTNNFKMSSNTASHEMSSDLRKCKIDATLNARRMEGESRTNQSIFTGSEKKFDQVMEMYPSFIDDLKKRISQHILGFDEQKKNPEEEAMSREWISENAKNVRTAKEFVKKIIEHETGYAAAKELIDKNTEHEDKIWHSMGRIDQISFDEFFPESSIDESPFDEIIKSILDKQSLTLDDDEYIEVYNEIEKDKKVFYDTQELADDAFRHLVEKQRSADAFDEY